MRGDGRAGLVARSRAAASRPAACAARARRRWSPRPTSVLDPNVLTLGFARRFTEYKRPNLLLRDRAA